MSSSDRQEILVGYAPFDQLVREYEHVCYIEQNARLDVEELEMLNRRQVEIIRQQQAMRSVVRYVFGVLRKAVEAQIQE